MASADTTERPRLRALVVSNDDEVRGDLLAQVASSGHLVTAARSPAEAASRCAEGQLDLIVIDDQLLVAVHPSLVDQADADVLLLSDATPAAETRQLVDRLAGYVSRPVDPELLEVYVSGTAERVRLAHANRRLRDEMERTKLDWKAPVDAIQDPIAIVDADGGVIRANRSFALRFGKSEREIVGERDVDLFYGGVEPEGAMLRVGYLTYETSDLRIPGTFLVSHYPIQLERGPCIVYHLTDISARKQAEEALVRSETQLRQAQKMEAVGRLAGGVAHDFNNLLTTIVGFSELLMMQFPAGSERYSRAMQIHRAAERGATLARQLLTFSRTHVLRPEVVSLGDLLGDISKLLDRLIGEDIELTIDTGPGDDQVRVDRGQLEQVAMNLAVNSRDAMPRGGRLTFRVEPAEHFLCDGDGAQRCVVLAVSDTGVGMDAETLSQAFEPFFTTKEAGHGTGLGLSMVYSIVKQHGGDIEAESSAGAGTTFRIYLPAVDGMAAETAQPAAAPLDLTGDETVLLAEDDECVRNVVRAVLQNLGYRVYEATDGAQALDLAVARDGDVDLLLTDLVMPELSGGELITALAARYPHVKVLLMSGYPPNSQRFVGTIDPATPFLQKPFTAISLARKLRQVLEGEER